MPNVVKESAHGMGATTWEVTYKVTIPYGLVGIIGALFLGLGRALGETMAVTFVIGNAHNISASLFAPGNSIASTLANEFSEATDTDVRQLLDRVGPGAVYHHLSGAGGGPVHAAADVQILECGIMKPRPPTGRRLVDLMVSVWAVISALLGIAALIWILSGVIIRGLGALNLTFFTQLPTPPGMAGGGLANAILGTLAMTVAATLMSVPIGLLAGVYLAEFGQESRVADNSRFSANVLMGMPSIIVGVFAYTLVVLPLGHFSGYAGAVALAILMIPVITRTTEDMLRLVPNTLRESALALGAPRWKVTLTVVFRAAKAGLITGILLAVARVSGETAPLLFTALNSPYWFKSLSGPTPNLTVTIFNYAMSPYEDWQRMAWGASLLITVGVLAFTLVARFLCGSEK